MALSRTKKWSTELKTGFRQQILNKEIYPECSNKAYIKTIRKRFYPYLPYENFRKNWNSSVVEYRVGKARDLSNKGKSYDTMTLINSVFCTGTLTFLQVNEATLEKESYRSSQDSDFDQDESDGFSVDLTDFVE